MTSRAQVKIIPDYVKFITDFLQPFYRNNFKSRSDLQIQTNLLAGGLSSDRLSAERLCIVHRILLRRGCVWSKDEMPHTRLLAQKQLIFSLFFCERYVLLPQDMKTNKNMSSNRYRPIDIDTIALQPVKIC